MIETHDPFEGFLVTAFWGLMGVALAALVADIRFRALLRRERPDLDHDLLGQGFRRYQAFLAAGEYRRLGAANINRWGAITRLLRHATNLAGWALLAAWVGWKLAGGSSSL
jgi:hypothetical protein